MSADNWGTCFNCLRLAAQEKDAAEKKAAESYGRVPVEEYLRLRARAELPVEPNETLREDFGMRISDEGVFSADYRGSCSICGLVFEFNAEQKVPTPATPLVKYQEAHKRRRSAGK